MEKSIGVRVPSLVPSPPKATTLNVQRSTPNVQLQTVLIERWALDVKRWALNGLFPMTNQEIERKFLLKTLPANLGSFPHRQIEQGYLAATSDGRQVRLRRTESSCTLTFKTADGPVREEREIKITPEQFTVLWPATAGKRLTKVRYDVPWNNFKVEIDVYGGVNQGVVVAEVEFADQAQCEQFRPPDWFGEEVTNNPRYSNVVLARE